MKNVGETNIKNLTLDFLDDMINTKNLDPININKDEKWYKDILIYYSEYVTPNSVNPLYLIISKINDYIDKHNRNILIKAKKH